MESQKTKYLRSELEGIVPYTPGEQPNLGKKVVKLNTNENPYPPSPKIAETIEQILTEGLLRKYPNYNGKYLRESIARKFDVHPDQILVTNGSDEALRLLFQAVLGPGSTMLVPDPTYSLYPVLCESLMCDINFLRVPLLSNLKFDFPALRQSKADLFAFAHPNAPTGILEDKKDLTSFVQNFPGIVLSDEAYIDFAPAKASLIDQIQSLPNLVVSRTFSKSYSLAGLRVGYLVGEKNIIQQISKLKDSYNVGLLEQQIALTALEDEEYFQKNINLVISERERLTKVLRELGFYIPDSHTNFIFCKPPTNFGPEFIYQTLKAKDILVRYFSTGLAKDYIRISIGSARENEELISEIKNIMKK